MNWTEGTKVLTTWTNLHTIFNGFLGSYIQNITKRFFTPNKFPLEKYYYS